MKPWLIQFRVPLCFNLRNRTLIFFRNKIDIYKITLITDCLYSWRINVDDSFAVVHEMKLFHQKHMVVKLRISYPYMYFHVISRCYTILHVLTCFYMLSHSVTCFTWSFLDPSISFISSLHTQEPTARSTQNILVIKKSRNNLKTTKLEGDLKRKRSKIIQKIK